MLHREKSYEALRQSFRWDIPTKYNIAASVCDDWALIDPDRPAIYDATYATPRVTTYDDLRISSNRLASFLKARGISHGDRVAILLPQMAEVAIAHIAAYKLATIAVPLAALFGSEALGFRLKDSGARVLITDAGGCAKLRTLLDTLPDLEIIISIDGPDGDILGFDRCLASSSCDFDRADTCADDEAMMIYTSGTTGPPKGAIHAHRVLLGHLPGVQLPHEFLPQPNDRFWTPADWAWAGGLLNVLLPSLHLGVPVVARRTIGFDPDDALELMARMQIRNVFLPPTALRMMRNASPKSYSGMNLRTIASGGESLGTEIYHWGQRTFGLAINEFYGQTECNLVIASCAQIGTTRAGAIGRAVPGHDVDIIRADGSICGNGEMGQIAIRRPDPVMFLGYWKQPEATAAKFIGDWMTTGDLGRRDADGYIYFMSRDDDVITSSGYRIGPGEVEDCLLGHPAVLMSAAIGKPDPLRTEIVKSFVVLRDGIEPSTTLTKELQEFVRARLSAHEYPREIEFVTSLPLTTSGKIIRRHLRERP